MSSAVQLSVYPALDNTLAPESQPIPEEANDNAAASRALDAGVPDGGYGWVVLASCSTLCFWAVVPAFSCHWAPKKTAFVGISFIALGDILSGFTAKHVAGLFITTGLVSGFGGSLCFTVMAALPAQYFGRKRGLANGIVFASSSLGGAVNSFLIDALITRLSIAWAFWILGLATFATGMISVVYIKDRVPPRRKRFVDWTLFRDSRFLTLWIASAVATFPLLVPPFFIPLYGVTLGISASAATAIVAGYNLASAVGRIAAGFCSDRFGPVNTLFASLLLCGITMLAVWPFAYTLGSLIAFALVNGPACGAFFALMPTVATHVFGSDQTSTVMGMLVTGWGGGYLLGSPIAAYITAASGEQNAGFNAYKPSFYYAGALALASAGLVALARRLINPSLLKRL